MNGIGSRKIRVAVSQRICPQWRVPVYRELAKRPGIDLTVYFGRGAPSGSNRNAQTYDGFRHVTLPTISFLIRSNEVEKYRAIHPTLPFHIILGRHDIVIVEPVTNLMNNLLLFPICKLMGKGVIWHESGGRDTGSRLRQFVDPLVNLLMRNADAYITYNSHADRVLLDRGIPEEKVFRAQNALDTESIVRHAENFRLLALEKRSHQGSARAKVATYVGGIEKRKRIENLVAATAKLRREGVNARAIIVGDGPYLEELRGHLSPEESAGVEFVGRRESDAALFIQMSDVVVLPGQGGLAINHALACGRPCIATEEAEGPGVHDYIQDGVNGFVVGVNDVDALASRMSRIFQDPDLQARLSQGAWETSRELSVEKMVNGIEKAIHYAFSARRQR